MRTHIVQNERGGMAALLSVVVLSMIIVTSLMSTYAYLENRTRYQRFMKLNYQMGMVMEDVGRAVLQAYQNTTSCPNNATATLKYLDCLQVCMPATNTYPGTIPSGTPQYAVCVKNDILNKTINNADYFCVYNMDANSNATPPVAPSYCSSLPVAENATSAAMIAMNPVQQMKPSKIERWYSRLNKFFDTTVVRKAPQAANVMTAALGYELQPPRFFGWLLPEKAHAGSYLPPPNGYPPPTGGSNGGGGIDTGAAGGHPPSVSECTSDPSGIGCVSLCDSSSNFSFCPNSKAGVVLGTMNCSGANMTNSSSCKPCGKNQRNGTNGACLDVAFCPPWVNNAECTRSGGIINNVDVRIHEVVKVQ